MKKIRLILPLLAFALLFSCSKEIEFENELGTSATELDESTEFEKEIQIMPSESEKSSVSSISRKLTPCDNPLYGEDAVIPGSLVTYTVVPKRPTRNPSKIKWLTTGNWKIVGGQGTRRVTIRAGSNFRGGEVRVDLGVKCATIKKVREDVARCPTRLSIAYAAGANGCDDFLATIFGANDVSSVKWSYSIQSIRNRPFGNVSYLPRHRGYTISRPLYLPRGDYDNHDLWVTARITLTNGSTCTVKGKTLLKCFDGGGNQR